MLIENTDTFLSELSKLFAKNQADPSSLYISMKRWDGRTKPLPRKRSSPDYKPKRRRRKPQTSESAIEGMCLIRAQLGKKKISTVIATKEINKFQQAYSNLLKGNLHGLKKKEKKKAGVGAKTSKGKATQ